MTDPHWQARLLEEFERFYREEAHRAARLQVRRLEARRALPAGAAQPLRYDESGFPISPGRASLTDRIRRLVAG